jgi:hypothetical protein
MKFSIHPTLYLTLFSFLVVLQSCKKDDPEVINEEEEINRVTLQVTPSGGSATSYTWNDGDGALSVALSSDTSYEVKVFFYDASDPNDIEDITEEVREEADEHLVFYEIASAAPAQISAASNDTKDGDNVPVGLITTWTTSAAGSANAKLFLIHEPTNKAGSSRSAIGGETDVEIDLAITVN